MENKCSMFSLRQLFEDKKCIKYKFVVELLTQWLESFSNDITLMKREYTDIELTRCLKYKTTNHCIFYCSNKCSLLYLCPHNIRKDCSENIGKKKKKKKKEDKKKL